MTFWLDKATAFGLHVSVNIFKNCKCSMALFSMVGRRGREGICSLLPRLSCDQIVWVVRRDLALAKSSTLTYWTDLNCSYQIGHAAPKNCGRHCRRERKFRHSRQRCVFWGLALDKIRTHTHTWPQTATGITTFAYWSFQAISGRQYIWSVWYSKVGLFQQKNAPTAVFRIPANWKNKYYEVQALATTAFRLSKIKSETMHVSWRCTKENVPVSYHHVVLYRAAGCRLFMTLLWVKWA